MSKYVKELMMDQLRTDLADSRSMLILDFKGLDAVSEHQFRSDLRKKSIRVRTLKNTLARRIFTEIGVDGLSRYLEGPSVLVWGGAGVAELAKEISGQVKKLKKPAIKGGAVDGVVIGPEQVEDITKLPSREALIGRVAAMAIAPAQRVIALANAPIGSLASQLQTISEGASAEGDGGEEPAATPEAEGEAPAATTEAGS
ncbi:MAG: 50S ribosomal protein L10 [Paludisphaera borealis]|uniref:50S ribosomal protein L10 n=1 Tax=Paludisphaera borealis TaxID=1387353 RepID=UPI00283D1828|nr:50S ribosomal protein L10 [Paludisphaera borealis]MDR3617831.1 50S ribosomal protein L10 [Paludisphaera borealis]